MCELTLFWSTARSQMSPFESGVLQTSIPSADTVRMLLATEPPAALKKFVRLAKLSEMSCCGEPTASYRIAFSIVAICVR
jgi:hypothetical protein